MWLSSTLSCLLTSLRTPTYPLQTSCALFRLPLSHLLLPIIPIPIPIAPMQKMMSIIDFFAFYKEVLKLFYPFFVSVCVLDFLIIQKLSVLMEYVHVTGVTVDGHRTSHRLPAADKKRKHGGPRKKTRHPPHWS